MKTLLFDILYHIGTFLNKYDKRDFYVFLMDDNYDDFINLSDDYILRVYLRLCIKNKNISHILKLRNKINIYASDYVYLALKNNLPAAMIDNLMFNLNKIEFEALIFETMYECDYLDIILNYFDEKKHLFYEKLILRAVSHRYNYGIEMIIQRLSHHNKIKMYKMILDELDKINQSFIDRQHNYELFYDSELFEFNNIYLDYLKKLREITND